MEYLNEHRIEMVTFSHIYELMDELGLKNSNWHKIKNHERNLPRFKKNGDTSYDWHVHIKKVLVNKYGIRPEYLEKHTGKMFTVLPETADKPSVINDGAVPYASRQDLRGCLDEKGAM